MGSEMCIRDSSLSSSLLPSPMVPLVAVVIRTHVLVKSWLPAVSGDVRITRTTIGRSLRHSFSRRDAVEIQEYTHSIDRCIDLCTCT